MDRLGFDGARAMGVLWIAASVLAASTALAAPPPVAAYHLLGETWAGEDVAAPASDADYNDVAVYYNRRCTLGAGGDLAGESLYLRAVAAGAAERNALVVTLPGVPETVTLVSESGATSTPALDGVRVTLFADFRDAFTNPIGTFLNTTGSATTDAPWWRLDVTYADGQPGTPGCGKADFAIARPVDGVFIDATTTLPGSNLPLTGSFPGSFQMPAERVPLTTAYPEAGAWLQARIDGCDPQAADCHDDWHQAPDPAGIVDRGDLAQVLPLPPQPTCTDGVQNAEESGIDCGGVCPGSCQGAPTAAEVYDCNGVLHDTSGLVVHQFAGTIEYASLMGPGVGPGEEPTTLSAPRVVAGWYAFDPTVAASATYGPPAQTEYTMAHGEAFAVVWAGAHCMQTHPTFNSYAGQIYVQDDPSQDRYVLSQFFLVDPDGAQGNYGEIFLTLDDSTGTAITGMGLPSTPPAVGAFTTTGLYLAFQAGPGSPSESAQGVVTALTWADPPSCTDGMRNGDETGPDCGGSCGACAAGAANDCQPVRTPLDCSGAAPENPSLPVHHFSGHVTQIDDWDLRLPGVMEGDPIEGWYAFDPSMSGVYDAPSFLQYLYDHHTGQFQMVMRVGSMCFQSTEQDPFNFSSSIYVIDDHNPNPPLGWVRDGWEVYSREIASPSVWFTRGSMRIEMTSFGNLDAIVGTGLPIVPPRVTDFADQHGITLDIGEDGDPMSSWYAMVRGDATELCR